MILISSAILNLYILQVPIIPIDDVKIGVFASSYLLEQNQPIVTKGLSVTVDF
jgi:hypothetical protein